MDKNYIIPKNEYIKRQSYIDKILPYIDKNIIKVIVGQRRVGKSYMLYQIIDLILSTKPKSDIIYINKELNQFDDIKNEKDLMNYINDKKQKKGKTYLFIDEIQEIFQFEKLLRSLQAEGGYDIYITGSNAFLLSGELATYLSGRYIEIKVYGLSFNEFLTFHGLPNNNESLSAYLRYGGLPYLINLKLEDHIIFDYLKNIYAAILFKDVVSRHSIRNIHFLENLVTFLADNTGNLVSAKKISDYLKSQKMTISPNVVLNYLSYLEASFFIFKVNRSDISGKKIFEISEKYYFEDLGLRHSIIGYKLTDIGKILENLVFIHLKTRGFDVKTGKTGDKEIDFICERGGEKIYIQVAYQIKDDKTKNREFGNLLEIKDNYPKLVISMDEILGNTYEGIEHLNIRDFLSNFN